MGSPAIFKEEFFVFSDGEAAPAHVDDIPQRQDRDPSMHHIEGYMPVDGDFIWLAVNLENAEDAARLLEGATAKIRQETDTGEHVAVTGVALVGPDNEGIHGSVNNPPIV